MRSVSVLSIVIACSAVVVSEFKFDKDNVNDDEDTNSYNMANEQNDFFSEHRPNVTEERTITSEKRSDGIHHKVTITKKVRVPFTVQVEKRVPKIIEVPVDKPFNVYIPKPYPVYVEKKVPFEVKVPLPQPYTVEKKVPYPVKVLVDKPYTVHVPKPYPVEVEKKYEFTIEKKVPVEHKVPVKRPYPVHVIVEKEVKFPVETRVPVPVQVPYDKPVPIHVQRYVPVHVDKPMPYTVEQVSTYPVHVPLKIPIKVHHPEGQSLNFAGVNEQNLQQLDWMEANNSPQRVAIKGFEHQTNSFRPSLPNRQPFYGGPRMPTNNYRGNGGRLPMQVPLTGGQRHHIPNFHKPMNHHAPHGLHHVPFHFQNPNYSQLKNNYPVQPNTRHSQPSYKVNEASSESWTGHVQKPDSNVKSLFPPQLHHLNAQSHSQLSVHDLFNSQMTNTTSVTPPAPSESPTSFTIPQTVLHEPSTPHFQPQTQQPLRHQPFSLNAAGQSESHRGQGHWKWSPELQVPSSTFFQHSSLSGKNNSVEVKQALQQPKTATSFPQFDLKYNTAFQAQKTGTSSFLGGKISLSPIASALLSHQAPTTGQSTKTLIESTSNHRTTNSHHGNAQHLTANNNKPSTEPQQPVSYFGSKTVLGENELSYSSSISHGQNNGTPNRS